LPGGHRDAACSRSQCTDRDAHSVPDPQPDCNANSHAYHNTHLDRDPHLHQHLDADTQRHQYPNRHTYQYKHSDRYANILTAADPDTHIHPNTHTHIHIHIHPNTHPFGYPPPVRNAFSYSDPLS
jgi:hypothetical protein